MNQPMRVIMAAEYQNDYRVRLQFMPCAGEIVRIGLFPAGCNARRKLRRVVILTQAICNAAVRPLGAIQPDNFPRARHNDGKEQVVDFYPFLGRSAHPAIRAYLNPKQFAGFRIEYGDLVWGDYDLCFPIMDLYRNAINHDEAVQEAA